MRQSSVIIHKGRREEKYEIYVEDYVVSFLKEETGTLELSEFYFYGYRENNYKRYIIYGAGRDSRLAVFSKYSLLNEIGCRLTQAGPVFLVREENSIYEVKGYEVFYQDNKAMQSYLIDRNKEIENSRQDSASDERIQSIHINDAAVQKSEHNKVPHSMISLQLGIILVALVAIVINSTNSYDKMEQLNRSATEVLFAIENQEADVQPYEPDNNAAVGDSGREEDVLKLADLEREASAEENEGDEVPKEDEANAATLTDVTQDNPEANDAENQNESRGEEADEYKEVEALSRNVARYYEIERGDTLYTISRKIYGDTTHVAKICELNQIDDPDHIRYGQKIILP